MSDVALRTVGLGKKYHIGAQREQYRTRRDTLAKAARRPIERIRHPGAATDASEELWALRDVDLEVKQGEVLGIIGRNGAGKSTLLKVLSHITEPTEGRVEIRGRVASLLEVGTGFSPELTGRENIQLNGAILGMTRAEIKSKFDAIVEFSEIGRFLETPVKRYSSGMYVRLAFSVAAHLEPEILIVDEVLAVGDMEFQRKCLGKMGQVAGEGRTVLFVSHNMAAVQRLCSTGLLLEGGETAYRGTAVDTVRRYVESSSHDLENRELAWVAPDRPAPFGDVVRVHGYQITDDENHSVVGRLYSGREYTAHISFDLRRADAALIFMLAYYDKESQALLFVSDVHDMSAINFASAKPGTYTLSTRLPTEWFCSQGYEIELMCALHHIGWILPPDNATRLAFEVFREDEANPYAQDARLGMLAPAIRWSLRAEEESLPVES
jgi:lipopolysaccharide transport system ATP-binding protein